MSANRDDKRESGQPGGGAGRKDEVGRFGVYPMSGPHPAGHADIKQQASWGHGERGASGYEDHGGSELTLDSGQVLGGLNAGPGGEPVSEAGDRDIPPEQWISFVDAFSRQHMDWLATVEITGPGKRLVLVRQRRLKGVSFDRAAQERAYIEIGDTPEEHVTHTVERPTRVTLKQTAAGAHQGLEIASADGSITFVRFR